MAVWAKSHHIFVSGNQINHIMKVTKPKFEVKENRTLVAYARLTDPKLAII